MKKTKNQKSNVEIYFRKKNHRNRVHQKNNNNAATNYNIKIKNISYNLYKIKLAIHTYIPQT